MREYEKKRADQSWTWVVDVDQVLFTQESCERKFSMADSARAIDGFREMAGLEPYRKGMLPNH
jgi:hypothetical protein